MRATAGREAVEAEARALRGGGGGQLALVVLATRMLTLFPISMMTIDWLAFWRASSSLSRHGHREEAEQRRKEM